MLTLPRAIRPGHSQLIGLASISDSRLVASTLARPFGCAFPPSSPHNLHNAESPAGFKGTVASVNLHSSSPVWPASRRRVLQARFITVRKYHDMPTREVLRAMCIDAASFGTTRTAGGHKLPSFQR